MERETAYRLKNKAEFILRLTENEFEYDSAFRAVFSYNLKDPIIANIISEGGVGDFLIIPRDMESEENLKKQERERLRKLVDSL